MIIGIVDDIASERSLLRSRLEKQLSTHGITATFFEYENGEDFLKASEEQTFQVLFLDIYMEGANGIEIAKKFRRSDKNCLLIFTTSSTDHALEGFQVRAMHYLVKPYTDIELSALTDAILSRIPAPEKYLSLKINGTPLRIPLKNIIYAEHFSHMIHIHTTAGKELITRQSFKSFTDLLQDDPCFFICNRGTVINLGHAVDLSGSVFLLDDESKIGVSRDLVKTAQQTFMDYLFQRRPF